MKARVKMGNQPAGAEHVAQELGNGLAIMLGVLREVVDAAEHEIHGQTVACANQVSIRKARDRQAEVDCIPVEDAGGSGREHRTDAKVRQCLRGLLARRADPEPFAGDDEVALTHTARELRIDGFETVLCQLFERLAHCMSRSKQIRIDVVAEYPGTAAQIVEVASHDPAQWSRARGSVTHPATADAATVNGEPRYTCDVG